MSKRVVRRPGRGRQHLQEGARSRGAGALGGSRGRGDSETGGATGRLTQTEKRWWGVRLCSAFGGRVREGLGSGRTCYGFMLRVIQEEAVGAGRQGAGPEGTSDLSGDAERARRQRDAVWDAAGLGRGAGGVRGGPELAGKCRGGLERDMTGSVWDESRPSRGHPSGGDEWLATGAAGKSPCWGGTLGSSVEGDLQSPSAEGPRPLGDGRPCEASGTWTVQHRPTGHTLGRHCPAKAPRLPTRNRELTSPLCQPGKLWVPRHTTVRL